MSNSNRVEEMVEILQRWQGIERQSMSDTAEIMEKSGSPLIRIIMEIIRHDSLMHHRVQQFLIDSVTVKDVVVTREDVAEVWDAIEAHDRTERKTIEMAETLINQAWNPVHKQLLDYLVTDERKHDGLLVQLGEIKSGMSKTSGG